MTERELYQYLKKHDVLTATAEISCEECPIKCGGHRCESSLKKFYSHLVEVTGEDSENHKKWERFKTHISHIHEFQDDECGGCERESADNCRKCMQELYWYNLKCYFDGEYIL